MFRVAEADRRSRTAAPRPRGRRRPSEPGFTLIEVLVALAVAAVLIGSVGSVFATNLVGVRSVDERVALSQYARLALESLPVRESIEPGSLTGKLDGYVWRVDIGPARGIILDPKHPPPWIPLAVVITIRSPSGRSMDIETLRLVRNAASPTTNPGENQRPNQRSNQGPNQGPEL